MEFDEVVNALKDKANGETLEVSIVVGHHSAQDLETELAAQGIRARVKGIAPGILDRPAFGEKKFRITLE